MTRHQATGILTSVSTERGSRLHPTGTAGWTRVFAAIALMLFMTAPSIGHGAPGFRPVPFHSATIDGKNARLLFEPSSQRFRVSALQQIWTLPEGFVPQAFARPSSGVLLAIGRTALRAEIQIIRLAAKGRVERIYIDPKLAQRLYLMHAFSAFGTLLAVVYDVEETFASGRSGSVVRDGVDLYRIDVAGGKASFTRLVDKAQIAGLDSAFRDLSIGGEHISCAQSGCFRIRVTPSLGPASIEVIRPSEWAGFAQVQMFVRDGQPRALLRRDEDDRFTPPATIQDVIYKDCPISATATCTALPNEDLVAGVDPNGRFLRVSSCTDIEQLLRSELARLPNIGLPYLAIDNHEGRISWGQVYVLDGLLDLATGLALPGPRFDRIRQEAVERADLEVSYWAQLAQTDQPWFWSRRYSLDRADTVSVLHLGRMARVASRLLSVKDDSATRRLVELLNVELTTFSRSIEAPDGALLKIKKGVRFWFDGGNVAWNYQSGWIEGIAELESSGIKSDQSRQLAIDMTRSFISTEIEPSRPRLWNYCAGRCQEGWSAADNISDNTPNWEGNKTRTATAHTSYRAMDARAVLEAIYRWKLTDLDWFIPYARTLVETGWNYPMVAAPLARHGVRPALSPELQLRYGRSAIPFDIHNQIWALDALARRLPGCTRD
jgi:hypothetical protein